MPRVGVAALIGAAPTLPRAIGFELTDTAAFGEMRAVYGGLFLALGVADRRGSAATRRCRLVDGSRCALRGARVRPARSAPLLDGPVRYTLITALVEVGGAALLIYASLRLEDVG